MDIRERAVSIFGYVCTIAAKMLEVPCHIRQGVEVCRKKYSTFVLVVEVVQASVSNSDTILGSCPPANLIHDDLEEKS